MVSEVVFDRTVKARQRAVASLAADSSEYDYLREVVAQRVVNRLHDIDNRTFPEALDVGCHTGHVRRALAAQADIGIRALTQCDMAATVVSECERRAKAEDASTFTLSYAVGDEEALPFEPYSFDVVFSCLALHWVNNLPLALFNIRHMLKNDGVFVGALLGGGTLAELQYAFAAADEERRGGVGLHCSPSTRVADVGSLMQQAGFTLITIDVDKIVVDYADPLVLLDDLQRMGEQHAPARHATKPVPRDAFLAMAAAYHQLFKSHTQPNAIRATFEVIYLIGWAPDDSQPKPLHPGSASTRLDDVLRSY